MDESTGLLPDTDLSARVTRLFEKARRMGAAPAVLIFLGLVALPAGTQTLRVHGAIHDGLGELARGYDANLPPLHLAGGRASVEGEEPAIFPKPGSAAAAEAAGRFVIIYDTTGGTERIPAECEAGVLVTSDTLVIKGDQAQTREISLEEVHRITGDLVLSGDLVRKSQTWWAGLAALVLGTAVGIYTVLAKLFQAVVLGILGVILTKGPGSLDFLEGLRIGLVALVPAVALQAIESVSGLSLPASNALYLGLAGACAWMGARRVTRARAGLLAQAQGIASRPVVLEAEGSSRAR